MEISRMNESLQWLRDKYAVAGDGEIVRSPKCSSGASGMLQLSGGGIVRLLPWRGERRFVELKKMVDGGTLEGVSTLRFAYFSADRSLRQLLYRELDLCAYLGESDVRSIYATVNGGTANALVRLFDGKSCSLECSSVLPAGSGPIDRHELIAKRGVACDRTVDTQVPQASIYSFTAAGESHYTDIDTELFGFTTDEILLIRAAYAVLAAPELTAQWNAIDARLESQIDDALATERNGRPIIYKEDK